jgi:hypothetical protein
MYNAVFSVMNDHKEIWSGVFQLKSVFGKFSENLSHLTTLKTAQEMDLQPLLDAVSEKRESLTILVNPVANIILAYAHDKDEKELIKKLNLSKKKLAKSKDSDLIEKCKTIYKGAKKLYKKSLEKSERSENKAVNIIEYGLSEKMIIDLEAAVKDFIKSRLALHEAILDKDKYGKQITKVLKKNEKLLVNKMDLLLSIFATSNAEFYKTYMDARVIQIEEPVKIKNKKEKKSEEKKQKKESEAEL